MDPGGSVEDGADIGWVGVVVRDRLTVEVAELSGGDYVLDLWSDGDEPVERRAGGVEAPARLLLRAACGHPRSAGVGHPEGAGGRAHEALVAESVEDRADELGRRGDGVGSADERGEALDRQRQQDRVIADVHRRI